MLVLCRKKGESVICGNGVVKVTILEIGGNKIHLGFEAAPDVRIHREEVQKAIEAGVAKKRASTPPQTNRSVAGPGDNEAKNQ